MDEYVQLDHMSALRDHENLKVKYLSNHAVIKESSMSIRFQVVFDASSPTISGRSLNDCLLVGPTIQSSVRDFDMISTTLICNDWRYSQDISINNDQTRAISMYILWRAMPNQ